MEQTKGKFICVINDIPAGSSKPFAGPGGKPGILFNIGGVLKAFVNHCPHQGGPVALSQLPDGVSVLQCQFHGALFDPISGMRLSGPPPEGSSLRELRVVLEEEKVYYE